jgi:hypothetical protein
MKQIFKVYESGTLLEKIQLCLKEGFVPLNGEQISKAIRNKSIEDKSYYSRTLLTKDNMFRDATLEELKNIKKTYDDGCRLVWFGRVDSNLDRSSAYSNYGLLHYDDGSLVGVKSSGAIKKYKKGDT